MSFIRLMIVSCLLGHSGTSCCDALGDSLYAWLEEHAIDSGSVPQVKLPCFDNDLVMSEHPSFLAQAGLWWTWIQFLHHQHEQDPGNRDAGLLIPWDAGYSDLPHPGTIVKVLARRDPSGWAERAATEGLLGKAAIADLMADCLRSTFSNERRDLPVETLNQVHYGALLPMHSAESSAPRKRRHILLDLETSDALTGLQKLEAYMIRFPDPKDARLRSRERSGYLEITYLTHWPLQFGEQAPRSSSCRFILGIYSGRLYVTTDHYKEGSFFELVPDRG